MLTLFFYNLEQEVLNNIESQKEDKPIVKKKKDDKNAKTSTTTVSQAQRKIITCNFMQKPQLKKQIVDSKRIAQLVIYD